LTWVDDHEHTLATLRQGLVDNWLASGKAPQPRSSIKPENVRGCLFALVLRYLEGQSQVVNLREANVMQDATFGEAPTFNTDVGFSLALSPDKKAFTATFRA